MTDAAVYTALFFVYISDLLGITVVIVIVIAIVTVIGISIIFLNVGCSRWLALRSTLLACVGLK